MKKRVKTKFQGVYSREVNSKLYPDRMDRQYYIVFRINAKLFELIVGSKDVDNMTPANAAKIRAEYIAGKLLRL